MFKGERCIIFDESGNLGNRGRYFVIACIDTMEAKSLHNIMKNKLKKAKSEFPELNVHANEIKANEAYPCIKYHILESILRKNVKISYIVVDLEYVEERLLEDKNILYNYIMKIIISKLITVKDKGTKINIICDKKTTKVTSINSLKDYIKVFLNYERGYDLDLNIVELDSDAGDAYIVQAADYVANALYAYYEYNNDLYKNIIDSKVHVVELFPKKKFGK